MKNWAVLFFILGLISVAQVDAFRSKILGSILSIVGDENYTEHKRTPDASLNAINILLWLLNHNNITEVTTIETKPSTLSHCPVVNRTKSTTERPVTTQKPAPHILDVHKVKLNRYRFRTASKAIRKICTSGELEATGKKAETAPTASDMQLQFCAKCSCVNAKLTKPRKVLKSLDVTKKVVIFVNGFAVMAKDLHIIEDAYNCRNDTNFVTLDIASHINTLRSWYTLDVQAIGLALGNTLVSLANKFPVSDIHLIGHSLGAHVVGYAAREFRKSTQNVIPRITALDPAKLCFSAGQRGLQRGDAEFLDVIHSNPNILGIINPMGDTDFYPGGLTSKKKGCRSVICSHLRSVEYYAESVYPGYESTLMGVYCSSLRSLREGKCDDTGPLPMGYAISTETRGNYFMEVNKKFPYGKGANGPLNLSPKKCEICAKEILQDALISTDNNSNNSESISN